MPPFHKAPNLSHVPHGFFTAQGGISQGGYSSLNCSFKTADDPQNITHNLERVLNLFDKSTQALCYLTQIHSGTILQAENTVCGEKADGLICDDPKRAICITTADCIPVLFSSENGEIVGAVHAGWRGLTRNILENTLEAFEKKGIGASSLHVAIGPSIAQKHYEIGTDMLDILRQCDKQIDNFLKKSHRPDHYLFDIKGWCLSRLRRLGVSNCHDIGIDTYARTNKCFSHRYATHHHLGPVGRQISLISSR